MPDDQTPLPTEAAFPPPMTINVFRQGVNVAVRQLLALLGLLLIVLAVPVAFATPFIPVGLPMGIVGVVLLGRNAVWGRRWMEGMLVRHPRLERMAPNWLMKTVFGRDKRILAD